MYKLRDGVVLISIQGVNILAADKKAREYCPYMKKINETGAVLWKLLEEKKSPEEILRIFMDTYEIEDIDQVKHDIDDSLDYLRNNGYMVI